MTDTKQAAGGTSPAPKRRRTPARTTMARDELAAVTARAEAAGISAADWARLVIEAALKS